MKYAPGLFNFNDIKDAAQPIEPRAFRATSLLALLALAIFGSLWWVQLNLMVGFKPMFAPALLILSFPICMIGGTCVAWYKVCDGRIMEWWYRLFNDIFNTKYALLYHYIVQGREEYSGLAMSILTRSAAKRYKSDGFGDNAIGVLMPLSGGWGRIVSRSLVQVAMKDWRVRIYKVYEKREWIVCEMRRTDRTAFKVPATHIIQVLDALHKKKDIGILLIELMGDARDLLELRDLVIKLDAEHKSAVTERDKIIDRFSQAKDGLDQLRLATRTVEGIMRGANRCHRHIGFLRSWEAMLDALKDIHFRVGEQSDAREYTARLDEVRKTIEELRNTQKRSRAAGTKQSAV